VEWLEKTLHSLQGFLLFGLRYWRFMTNVSSDWALSVRERLAGCRQLEAARILRLLGKLKGEPGSRDRERVERWLSAGEARFQARGSHGLTLVFPDALPVSGHAQEIERLLERHQVLVVAGETGSGKTTQLPKICLKAGRGRRGLIGHTQPRRLAARSVAARLSEEMGDPRGDYVGYQVRFTDTTGPDALVKVMTDGILLAEIAQDRFLDRYDTLIIDEAHERSLNVDFLLGYIKRLLPKRPDLRVIITSATIEVDRFSRFFNDAPVVEVSGRTYPVEVRYRPLTGEGEATDLGWPEAIGEAIGEIADHERQNGQGPGDVLVFLPGEGEIRDVSKYLRHQNLRDTEVLPLYARLSAAEQNRVFQGHAGRRIVLATNVAETSLTVPGIRYVVDTGRARISRYSVRSKLQRLPVEAISRASADQRKGRCGRVAPGICFRLYSEADFLGRPEYTDPEILRTNLAAVILQMSALGLGEVQKFPFLDAPDNRLVSDGFRVLEELGAVDGRRITRTGRILARLPVDPRIGRMLVAANELGSLAEVLVIAAGLSVQDPRERPADRQQAADQMHAEYADRDSDFLSLLNLWRRFEDERQARSQNQLRQFCRKRFLSWLRLREWRETHRQLMLMVRDQGFRMNQVEADYAAIHKSILTGLLGQVAQRHEGREYLGTRNRKLMVFPGSPVAKKPPKWIVAAEIVETSRVFARTVARIDVEWIEPLAGHVVKRHYFEPHWESRRAQVMGFEKVTLYGLEIVARRRISYSRIDPVVSRDLFIRRGLVEGDYRTRAPFLEANRKLVETLETLEDKSRRRDIVVDEETLFGLYDERIPPDVVSGTHFESWWRNLSADELKALYLSREQLLKDQETAAIEQAYPDYLEWEGVRYPLTYHFSPGAPDDGVTLRVPLMALRQIPVHRLEWLVPGLLREKCIALVKGLPKAMRKNFVPVPDFVSAALANLSPENVPLTQRLGEELARMTGVRVDPTYWSQSHQGLEPHFRMNLRVVDDRGKPCAEGRDVEDLMHRLESRADQALASRDSRAKEEKPRSSPRWQFEPVPESVDAEQGGVMVRVYPALEDRGAEVAETRLLDPVAARRTHRRGVARLILNDLAGSLSGIERELAFFEASALLFAPTGRRRGLLDDLLLAAAQAHFLDDALPRDKADYRRLLDDRRGDFRETLERLDRLCHEILSRHHEVMKALKGQVPLALAQGYADIKFQMGHLVFQGFLTGTPVEWLEHVPRYIQAAQLRLEKMPREMGRERQFLHEFPPLWQRYEKRRESLRQQGVDDPELTYYRWMLEEYRVSFFAQTLGTALSVSIPRLDRQWQKVRS